MKKKENGNKEKKKSVKPKPVLGGGGKINKPLARLIKEKEKKWPKSKVKEAISTDSMELKEVWEYCQLD